MFKKATDIFNDWAENDKDQGMEKNHSNAVETMLNLLVENKITPFTFLDAGCGNGWVVRKIKKHSFCKMAIGIDGAKGMIEKAKKIDPKGIYIYKDLMLWTPKSKFNIIHSMEVLYYFNKPESLLSHMLEKWLEPNGEIISGIDYYLENVESHSWPKDLNTQMKLLSKKDWKILFEDCGLKDVQTFQTNASKKFPGTLIIYGRNKVK